MAKLFRKRGLAAKTETTYNTDPTISEASDSVQHRNLEIVPLDGDFVNRNLDSAALGAEGDILVASRCLMNFEVEAAGGGGADTPPPWASVLQACGFAETVNASTSVQYDPVSASFDSIWMEGNADGLQAIAGGARGNMSLNWSTKDIPQFGFSFQGLYGGVSDVALPSYTLSAFQTPEAFNNANTVTATLLGQSIALESIALDLQNQIVHRDVISNEEILLVDRDVRGTISFEAVSIATYNWFSAVAARTAGALAITHGDTPGNIVALTAPAVEVSNPRFRNSDGVLMLDLDLICKPNAAAGNDEIRITTS